MDAASEELMQRLQAEHAEMIRAIVEANRDLATRGQALGVRAEYDSDEDVISVAIGPVVERARAAGIASGFGLAGTRAEAV